MDMSSLTVFDNINISATFIYMTDDKFKCEHKLKQLTKRMGHDAAQLQLRKTNGCGIYSEKHRYAIDGIQYHSCLCGYREYDIGFLLELQRKLEQGILPFDGCYMDQPSQIMEILDRIEYLKLDKQDRDTKKNESDTKLKDSNRGIKR